MASVDEKLMATVGRANLMTPRQRELVERDIKSLERQLHGEAVPYYGTDEIARQYQPGAEGTVPEAGTIYLRRDVPIPDRANLEKVLAECHKTLQMGTAPALSVAAKNAIFKKYQEEVAQYQEGMPSFDQMWKPGYQNLLLHQQHRKANVKRARWLQNAHRILDKDDDLFHLEALRPDKPTPFNTAAYRSGFQRLQWTDEKELELQVQELDEATYHQFLLMKAQGISSEKLYRDKLGLSVAQYEACQARLRASAAQFGLDAPAPAVPPVAPSAPVPAVVPRAPGRPPAAKPSAGGRPASPAQRPLTEKAQEAVNLYGSLLCEVAAEGALSETAAMAVLLELNPEQFPSQFVALNTARTVLRSLVRLGTLVQDGKEYRAVAPVETGAPA